MSTGNRNHHFSPEKINNRYLGNRNTRHNQYNNNNHNANYNTHNQSYNNYNNGRNNYHTNNYNENGAQNMYNGHNNGGNYNGFNNNYNKRNKYGKKDDTSWLTNVNSDDTMKEIRAYKEAEQLEKLQKEFGPINQLIDADKKKYGKQIDRIKQKQQQQQEHKENKVMQQMTNNLGKLQVNDDKQEKILIKSDNPYHPHNFYKKKQNKSPQKQQKQQQSMTNGYHHNDNDHKSNGYNHGYNGYVQNGRNNNNQQQTYYNQNGMNDDQYYDPEWNVNDDFDDLSPKSTGSMPSEEILTDHSNINQMSDGLRIDATNILQQLKRGDTVLVLGDNNIDFMVLTFESITFTHNEDDDVEVSFKDWDNKPIYYFFNKKGYKLPPIFKPNTNRNSPNNNNKKISPKNANNANNANHDVQIGTRIEIEMDGSFYLYTIQSYDPLTTKAMLTDITGGQHIVFLKNTPYTLADKRRSYALPITK